MTWYEIFIVQSINDTEVNLIYCIVSKTQQVMVKFKITEPVQPRSDGNSQKSREFSPVKE